MLEVINGEHTKEIVRIQFTTKQDNMRESLSQKIRMFISNIGWKLFIWGNDFTEEEYWEQIYEQEKSYREKNNL
jgi:hypothetical protein